MTLLIGSKLGRLVALLICALWVGPAVAELRVTVDQTEITDADLLKLTIRVDNTTSSTNPDFQALEQDFEIMQRSGPNQSSRISIINGRQTSEVYVTWEFRLRPKRLGTLTIPSFRLGSDSSRPIQIRVNQQSEAMKRKMSQLVFFETSVDTNETYVQGQILYSVKLYYVENISGDFPAAPALQDVVVETIENERRFDAITNGRRYYVLEKRYGIYPQKSGTITIPPQTFSGYRVGPGFFSTREPVLSRSESHTITVKPKPAEFRGEHWLPATDLTLTANWVNGAPEFIVGEPINRSIEIEAKGVASSLLPSLEIEMVPGVKTYQDPPVEEQSVSADGINAKQTVVVGIVPTQPGTLVLPEIKIPWWNTQTDQLDIAIIPEETFIVAPSPNSVIATPQVLPQNDQPSSLVSQPNAAQEAPFWRFTTYGLLGCWILTLLIWFLLAKRSEPQNETPEASPDLDEAAALSELTKACRNNDGTAVLSTLIQWGSLRFGKLHSAGELAVVSNSSALQRAITELEQALYAEGPQRGWQGSELLAAIQEITKSKTNRAAKTSLAALNPN